jgi:hypothetical protein
MERFEIQPVLAAALPDVADFLLRWRENEPAPQPAIESPACVERRLRWLLVENPAVTEGSPLGLCLRDESGVIRGINLAFPASFLAGDNRLRGLCSGSFFVEPAARSMGFYLFKKYLASPGYSFYFATTCNAASSALWASLGACSVPNSETEYILPLRLDVVIPAFVANRTSSRIASGLAQAAGWCANPVLRFFTRPSAGLIIEACQDWEKLSELSRRHRAVNSVTMDRSPEYLRWQYGPISPAHPCGICLFRDKQGNEGWFSLANLRRGEEGQFRGSVLLNAIWPRESMSFQDIFQEIVRFAATSADAIFFRWQSGLNYSDYSRFVIPHRLPAPRAFVKTSKSGTPFEPHLLDYDDSDYVAWKFHWGRDPDLDESRETAAGGVGRT